MWNGNTFLFVSTVIRLRCIGELYEIQHGYKIFPPKYLRSPTFFHLSICIPHLCNKCLFELSTIVISLVANRKILSRSRSKLLTTPYARSTDSST